MLNIQGPVAVGRRNLYVECRGEGPVTVILESGAGCTSQDWDPIWETLHAQVRVFRYDRANLGRSDPAAKPRTCREIAEDLHTVVTNAAIPGPFVLVGHSFGGLCIRAFATMYPAHVAGMVLVDASHHEQQERGIAVLPPADPSEPEALRNFRAWVARPDTLNSEGVHIRRSQEQLCACLSVGDIPLVVLSRSRHVAWPGFPPDISAAMEQVWHEMQRDLTRLSPRSRWVIADNSGHYIQRDQPQLVLDAIMDVARAITPDHADAQRRSTAAPAQD